MRPVVGHRVVLGAAVVPHRDLVGGPLVVQAGTIFLALRESEAQCVFVKDVL